MPLRFVSLRRGTKYSVIIIIIIIIIKLDSKSVTDTQKKTLTAYTNVKVKLYIIYMVVVILWGRMECRALFFLSWVRDPLLMVIGSTAWCLFAPHGNALSRLISI